MKVKLIFISITLISLLSFSQRKVRYSQLEARNGIMFVKGEDTPFTGKCFRTFDNGKLGMAGYYYEGLMNGDWVWWYSNGNKKRYTQYKNGIKHGKNIFYYKNGKKRLEIIYYENKNIKQTRFDENGNVIPNPRLSPM